MDESEEHRKASWAKFKKVHDAYEAAKGRPEPFVIAMVEKCMLGSTAMQWAVRFAGVGAWERRRTPQMAEWLRAVWQGILQTIIIENTNRERRDKEVRGSTNKSYNKFGRWARPIDTAVLKKFERKEIVVKTYAPRHRSTSTWTPSSWLGMGRMGLAIRCPSSGSLARWIGTHGRTQAYWTPTPTSS